MLPETNQSSIAWLYFALMTVVCWGVYGILLHKGQMSMADPVNGRYKAFLFVGIAYFITAVLAPIIVLLLNKSDWSMPAAGSWWSLIAGVAGAVGAFSVLLAFGAKGSPSVVMTIVFAGAPVVNAVISIWLAGLWSDTPIQFWIGLVLAVAGGTLVTFYKPTPHPPAKAPSTVAPAVAPAIADKPSG